MTRAEEQEAGRTWRDRGYEDGSAGRKARTPIRDDGGAAAEAYTLGYRAGAREHRRRPGRPVKR